MRSAIASKPDCSPFFHPLGEGIALEGMRLVKEWLPVAVADGDLDRPRFMMAASSMGAIALPEGARRHARHEPSLLDASRGTHHGLTNAVVMPYVITFNWPFITDRMTRFARYLNLSNTSLDGLIDWVLQLREEIGVPHTLRELGVNEAQIDELAEMAAKDPTAGSNPVKIGAAELKRLYRNALEGKRCGSAAAAGCSGRSRAEAPRVSPQAIARSGRLRYEALTWRPLPAPSPRTMRRTAATPR